MRILHSIPELAGLNAPVSLAIGVFDGVHRGHQALIGAVQEAARERDAVPVAVTFEPHPLKVVRPKEAPPLLTSLEHKLLLLRRLGIDHALVIRFDKAFAQTPPKQFIRSLVAAGRPLRLIGVGFRWEFGHRRAGNVALLEELGRELDFDVLELPPVTEDNDHISSTRIRQAIADGNLEQARCLLGRPFSLYGAVVHGENLGRQIGYPTANLDVQGEKLPPDGVYAGTCAVDGRTYPVALNIGNRPTVGGTQRRIEAHLVGFDGALYGQFLEIPLIRFIRNEIRFECVEDLRRQISQDVETARAVASAA